MKLSSFLTVALALASAAAVNAQIVTHTGGTVAAQGVAVTPAFDTLVAGGVVGTSLIGYGVDYSFGGTEALFNDPPYAIGGVSNSGTVDLLTGVDGRIVVLDSLAQGLTDYVSVIAGFADPGTLRLSAYDSAHNLIASVFSGEDLDPITIDLHGVFDIAYFSVTTPGQDTFGVRSVSINTPIAANVPVPEPSTYALLGSLVLGVAVWARRRAVR
ncbi:hypothetical protein DB347_10025 [Opitutaceae bacterium EW11]|nr:hypothetical protein DB347_10025 [Opitutaceae bacterium EW11]